MTSTETAVAAAHRTAHATAERIGYSARSLEGLSELSAVPRLFSAVWQPKPFNAPLSTDTVTALSLAGCYVGGVFDHGTLVGACIGVFGEPDGRHLHSHIAAVDPAYRGRGIGTVLKLHQRAWALDRHVGEISWTFDPLVRRNAYFNIGKLGATVARYWENLYGVFGDPINGNDESDRLLAQWDLLSARVRSTVDGWPEPSSGLAFDGALAERITVLAVGPDQRPVVRESDASIVVVDVPNDIAQLRSSVPGVARDWRIAVREVLGGLLADGGEITSFHRDRGYVVQRSGQGARHADAPA